MCEDIDECFEGDTEACFNGNCINTQGSFECECEPGFVLDNTGRVCLGKYENQYLKFEIKMFQFHNQITEEELVGPK
jgi:hypothetical protein